MQRSVLSFLVGLWRKPLARFITSAAILALLLSMMPLSDLWDTLTQLSLGVWSTAVLVFVAAHVVGTVKWNLLINLGQRKIPFGAALRFYFAGLFANLFLPSMAGGDVIRAGMAIRHSQEKEAVILGSLLDRLLDVGALAVLIAGGVLLAPDVLASEGQSALRWVGIVFAGAALGGLGLLLLPLPKRTPEPLARLILRARHTIRELIKRPQRALAGFVISLFIQGTFILLNAYLAAAVGIDVALPAWFLAWPLAKISAMLPISLGGLGVREAALAALLGRFGVSTAGAVGVGLLWQTVVLAGGALGGLFYSLSRGGSRSPSIIAVAGTAQEELSS